MKVFVYDKKDSHVIAVFAHVCQVTYNDVTRIISIVDEFNETHSYNGKYVKTRVYQN